MIAGWKLEFSLYHEQKEIFAEYKKLNVAGEEDEEEGEQIYYEGEVMEDFVCKQR